MDKKGRQKTAFVLRGWKEDLFVKTLEARGYKVLPFDYKNLKLEFEGEKPAKNIVAGGKNLRVNGQVAIAPAISTGMKVNVYENDAVPLSDVDIVISRIFSRPEKGEALLGEMLHAGAVSSEGLEAHYLANHKGRTAHTLQAADLPIPATKTFTSNASPEDVSQDLTSLYEASGGSLVVKPTIGNRGKGVVFAESVEEAHKFVSDFQKKKRDVVVQSFIDTGERANHVRAIVVGGKLMTARRFTVPEGGRLSNLSQGATVEEIELNEAQKELVEKASKALGVTFAGVDMITDSQGRDYILEVNMTPNIASLNQEDQKRVAEAVLDITEQRYKEAFLSRVKNSWFPGTSADPENWADENPAWGQCAVSACLVQEEFGGDIVRASYRTPDGASSSHYFNILPDGERLDTTFSQFPDGTTFDPPLEESDKHLREKTQSYLDSQGFSGTADEYILSFGQTTRRYQTLKNRVADKTVPHVKGDEKQIIHER